MNAYCFGKFNPGDIARLRAAKPEVQPFSDPDASPLKDRPKLSSVSPLAASRHMRVPVPVRIIRFDVVPFERVDESGVAYAARRQSGDDFFVKIRHAPAFSRITALERCASELSESCA